MPPLLRKSTLTAHVIASVGWIGALAVFLAHAIASVTSTDQTIVRAASVMMAITAWAVIVPLSLASLITGLVQALCTPWGLVRHYWVTFKLLLTSIATVVLLLKLEPIFLLAELAAATTTASAGDTLGLRTSLLVHAVGGLAVLIAIAALAVFKPTGLTPWTAKRPDELSQPRTPYWVKIFGAAVLVLFLAIGLMLLGGEHGPAAHIPTGR
jgi:hypothetical protein